MKVVNKMNQVVIPVAIAYDAFRVCMAAIEDYKNDTYRNTIETTTKIGMGWAGGVAGIFPFPF